MDITQVEDLALLESARRDKNDIIELVTDIGCSVKIAVSSARQRHKSFTDSIARADGF